jgi:hypothetical protein
MINVQEFAKQYREINKRCEEIHRFHIQDGRYRGFDLDEDVITIHYRYFNSNDIESEDYPLEIVVKGLAAAIEWSNLKHENEQKEKEEQARRRVEQEIKDKEIRDRQEYERLKTKYGDI